MKSVEVGMAVGGVFRPRWSAAEPRDRLTPLFWLAQSTLNRNSCGEAGQALARIKGVNCCRSGDGRRPTALP